MKYNSRKFIIFWVVYFCVLALFSLDKLSQTNFMILVGELLTFYLGGNAWDKHKEKL